MYTANAIIHNALYSAGKFPLIEKPPSSSFASDQTFRPTPQTAQFTSCKTIQATAFFLCASNTVLPLQSRNTLYGPLICGVPYDLFNFVSIVCNAASGTSTVQSHREFSAQMTLYFKNRKEMLRNVRIQLIIEVPCSVVWTMTRRPAPTNLLRKRMRLAQAGMSSY
jgi:hypothetical protein